jgi:hypothetical protein
MSSGECEVFDDRCVGFAEDVALEAAEDVAFG